jgi:outer membrane protein OmpA-like peptidoglycan-associated protein
MWLKVIAARGAAQNACFQIVGHASRTGAVEANDRLSVQRAEYVRDRLIGLEPSLASRTVTTGVGSKEIMARSDADGPDNAVDRRVELKLVKCEQK